MSLLAPAAAASTAILAEENLHGRPADLRPGKASERTIEAADLFRQS
jgi:hypothetical protein